MPASQILKKEVTFDNIKIQLFEIDAREVQRDSVSNIQAINSDDKILWQAEAPKPKYETYYDFHFDVVSRQLIAVTGSGFHHIIDINTGKVLRHYLVK